MSPEDLTGDWSGSFAFPNGLPAAPFVAHLTQSAGWITGTVEEKGSSPETKGLVLTATLQGRRTGAHVVWLKLYDRDWPGYDAVSYEGEVSADGQTISGVWKIWNDWSGSFVMRRARGAARTVTRRTAVGL